MLCQLRGISKSYGSKKLFEGLSLEIPENAFLCITGRSGAGKSTLLNLIGLLEKPDAGTIDFLGYRNVRPGGRACTRLYREHIGFLFQNFALIDHKTLGYNWDIALAAAKTKRCLWREKKLALLEALQLEARLEDPVYRLSGGQQQRAAFGRLLLKNYDLLLADEPTGSLDGENRELILSLLKKEHDKGKAIVLASHDPVVAGSCERVLELSGLGLTPTP